MSHLTEEQFEDILRAPACMPEHVDRCPLCRARLDEKRALAQRVRQAFLTMETPAGLADRVRAGVAAPGTAGAATPGQTRLIPLYFRRHLWSALAAAAAILILAVPIGFYVNTGAQANAAQVALAEIHHTNLDSLGQLVMNDDPNALCRYLENQVGQRAALVCPVSGMSMCGCCVRKFQDQPVASYVVKRNNIPISVIVVPQPPEALGLVPAQRRPAAARDIWHARHQCCNIAAVRLGGYSYCAVGQAAPEELATLLNALPAPAETPR